ncbi:Os11g0529700 [Oryza sativa Japonica Group]|uniref:Os11g0529700 protein n=2 Tax=Oryza sativa subsp. japonica TaxID=39947 RepID=Q2R3A6_ORYSJ|nr:hypothetical protein LOC_Os11g32600 [Oryza sativa Japonica Group]EEE52210.1 hypothetical protein OsJ_34105 [Oryza sativa Japonica Group]BAT14274.1 Os11g0529700 [Oryza sativa Japonica Group]
MEYVESLKSVEVLDSVDALDIVNALDSVEGLESEMALDSVEVPDSVEVVPESVKVAPDFVKVAPDSVEVVQCPRCGTFHAGGVFGEACFQARRRARRCARCGLLHEDYDLIARFLHNMEKFDCELYIPDVEKLKMDGETILLPKHVIKKLDEIYSMKELEDAKMKQEQ